MGQFFAQNHGKIKIQKNIMATIDRKRNFCYIKISKNI